VNYLIVSIIRNLIVISNVRPDRLLPQEAIERANEYKKLFSSIRPDHEAFQQLQTKINKFTSYQKLSSTETGEMTENKKTPYDILSENSINEEDVSMLSKALNEVDGAMQGFQVQFVSELVVPLTCVSSMPVH